jgi:hypothetical protein
VEGNIARWEGQFATHVDKEQKETLDAGEIKITLVDLSGTFNDTMDPTGPAITRPDYRMLGAIFQIPGEDGLHFVKCYGPKKIIAERADEIKGFLTSLKVEDVKLDRPKDVAQGASGNVNGAAATSLDFGPVIERTLLVGDKNRCFFSLDRGKYVPSPTDFDPADKRNAAQFQRWLTANHVDIFVRQRNGRTVLVRSEMTVGSLDARVFDCPAVEQLNLGSFRQSFEQTPGLQTEFDSQDRQTDLFETRQEVNGLLQITGTTDDPPGLKIRYKLVQDAAKVQGYSPSNAPHFGKEKLPGIVPPAPAAENTPHLRALHFDGEHYAAQPQSPKFTAGDFTISLWFNPTTENKSNWLFMRAFGWRDQRGDIGLMINPHSGDLDFVANMGGNFQWIFGWDVPESRLRSAFRVNQWNHVVVTRRGDAYAMWMNGVKVGSERSSADISDSDNTNPFIVGGFTYDSGVEQRFQGALDEFRIFRRCLSDKEIDALYKSNGDEAFLHSEGRVDVAPLREAHWKGELLQGEKESNSSIMPSAGDDPAR